MSDEDAKQDYLEYCRDFDQIIEKRFRFLKLDTEKQQWVMTDQHGMSFPGYMSATLQVGNYLGADWLEKVYTNNFTYEHYVSVRRGWAIRKLLKLAERYWNSESVAGQWEKEL